MMIMLTGLRKINKESDQDRAGPANINMPVMLVFSKK
jgi:hypothetical protein